EDQSTPAQALGLEDAVRSAYRGERCTYVLNSGANTCVETAIARAVAATPAKCLQIIEKFPYGLLVVKHTSV
ncbi:hypothetical protein, partial [Pseudomonas sp.]|uniref:hypothetical protein n=1 Tax=Pseudomonas sp. TaxID=306 RepID=UPI00258020FF